MGGWSTNPDGECAMTALRAAVWVAAVTDGDERWIRKAGALAEEVNSGRKGDGSREQWGVSKMTDMAAKRGFRLCVWIGTHVALIDEKECIGCTLCIQECPVDAIVGAAKQLHGVIADECTGCELCLPPCPVECIHMIPIVESPGSWKWPYPAAPQKQAEDRQAA